MPVKAKKSPAKSKSGKTASKKTASKKTASKKTAAKKTVSKKTAVKKPIKKKSASNKIVTKKTAAKKTTPKVKAKKTVTPKKVSGKTLKKAVQKKSTSAKKTSIPSKKRISSKKFNAVKELLEARKQEILKEVASDLNSGLNSETAAYPDFSDLASIESDRNFEIRIKERERKLLKKINIALEQIKTGAFGICESCGEEIGTKRLLARPVATLCIQCKTDAEREEKTNNL